MDNTLETHGATWNPATRSHPGAYWGEQKAEKDILPECYIS